MLCQATWLPIKAKPWRWRVLASRVIGFSLKEWFSLHVNRLARRGGKTGPLFTKCKWLLWRKTMCSSCSNKPDRIQMKELECWRRSTSLRALPAPIHIWAAERPQHRSPPHQRATPSLVEIPQIQMCSKPIWLWIAWHLVKLLRSIQTAQTQVHADVLLNY